MVFLALMACTLRADSEWIDTDGDNNKDTLLLDPFEVNGNDPSTFDSSGYEYWADAVGVGADSAPTPDYFASYDDFWEWVDDASMVGSPAAAESGIEAAIRASWAAGSDSKGNCARYAFGDPLGNGQNYGNATNAHQSIPGVAGGVVSGYSEGLIEWGMACTPGITPYNGSSVPTGERLVYAAFSPGANAGAGDAHFYRQEEDGTWSDKMGNSSVRFGIPDPAADARSLGYTVPVVTGNSNNNGFYAVPVGGVNIDG